MNNETASGDYDYIIRIIQYLDLHFGIRFFISSKDFDLLYHWWEKRVPAAVVQESLDRVVARSRSRGKPIAHFVVFSNEVRRNYQSFLSRGIGSVRAEPTDAHADIREFFVKFPPELEFVKSDFEALFASTLQGGNADAGTLQEKLLDHFQNDGELNAKTAWFLKNLSPPLRRPEIERKYRLNYLFGKFAIPALD
jgi:hypothetical protein